MFSTREVLGLLAEANPTETVDEERLRRAIRVGSVHAPSMVAGRYVWDETEVSEVAAALGLQSPSIATEGGVR